MSLPPFLVAELRFAFRTCARGPVEKVHRHFSSLPLLRNPQPARVQPSTSPVSKSSAQKHDASSKSNLEAQGSEQGVSSSSATDLVPSGGGQRSIGRTRQVEVPLKVIPKADITPNVRLSPRQRLHLEMLTRRSPEKIQKKIYKEKLLIYHQGTGAEKAIILMKFFAITGFAANTSVIVPAMYTAGSPALICLIYLSLGFIPLTVFHSFTKAMVNRIYLHLPTKARETPEAAMEYARNLPSSAQLDIEFIRPIPTAGTVTAFLADLEPKSTWWRPTTFQWKQGTGDPGNVIMPNPLQFFVKPESSKGKAARYVVPRIWPDIFKRLTGQETEKVSKWKR